jgi:hypothetical protein
MIRRCHYLRCLCCRHISLAERQPPLRLLMRRWRRLRFCLSSFRHAFRFHDIRAGHAAARLQAAYFFFAFQRLFLSLPADIAAAISRQ